MHSPLSEPIRWADQSDWFDMPKQDRSRETMRRIFDAAIKLFAIRGYDRTTVQDIADEAGLSTGPIYRRFSDKEALLYTIIEAFGHTREPEMERMIDPARWRESSAADIIAFYIRVVVSSYRNDAGFIKVIERQCLVDPRVAEISARWNSFVAGAFATLLMPYADQVACADIAAAMDRLHTVLRGTLIYLTLPDAGLPATGMSLHDPALEGTLLKIANDYLGLRDAP